MDNRPSSLLIGNYVAVAAVAGGAVTPPQTVAFGVRVGLITDLHDKYVVLSIALLSLL